METIEHINAVDFNNEELNCKDFVILECYNDNNAILKTMEIVMLKLKSNLPVTFKHLRINTTDNPGIVDTFCIQKNPSYVVFFDGKFIDRLDGIASITDFDRRLNHNIIRHKIWKTIKVY